MRSDCCSASVRSYWDEEYGKVFYECCDCGNACSIGEVDNDTDEEIDVS